MTRAELHDLLDNVSDDQLEEARRRLAELVEDPVLRALTLAPFEDEPVSPRQAGVLDRRKQAASRGKTASTDDRSPTKSS